MKTPGLALASWLVLSSAAAAGLTSCGGRQLAPGERRAWRKAVGVIDLHTHIRREAVAKAVAAMDANGVERCVMLTPGSDVESFRRAKATFDAEAPGRFVFYVNDVYRTFPIEDPEYGSKVVRVLEECVKLGARGLKISKTLGLYWKDAQGRIVPVDDPRLDPLWEACGRLGVPVSIHVADPKAFWEPLNESNERWEELRLHPEWSFAGGEYPPREEILAQRNRVVARHPNTTFVGVHFGNNPEDVEYIADLLRKNPNFNVDIAARLGEIGRHDPELVRKIFIDFQDRILFGTDFMVFPRGYILGAGPVVEDPGEVSRFFDSHWEFLETDSRQFDHPTPIQGSWRIDGIGLPREVLLKIYRDNAVRLLKLDS